MIKRGEGLPSPLFDRLVGYCRSRVFGQKCLDGLLIVHADQFALLPLIVTLCEQDQAGNRLDLRDPIGKLFIFGKIQFRTVDISQCAFFVQLRHDASLHNLTGTTPISAHKYQEGLT